MSDPKFGPFESQMGSLRVRQTVPVSIEFTKRRQLLVTESTMTIAHVPNLCLLHWLRYQPYIPRFHLIFSLPPGSNTPSTIGLII